MKGDRLHLRSPFIAPSIWFGSACTARSSVPRKTLQPRLPGGGLFIAVLLGSKSKRAPLQHSKAQMLTAHPPTPLTIYAIHRSM